MMPDEQKPKHDFAAHEKHLQELEAEHFAPGGLMRPLRPPVPGATGASHTAPHLQPKPDSTKTP